MAIRWTKDKEGFKMNSRLARSRVKEKMVLKDIADSSQLLVPGLLELYETFKFGTMTVYYFGIRKNDEAF